MGITRLEMSDNPSHHKELLLVREANEDTDSPAETHLTKKRIASEELSHKYRKGMPFEGPHPDEMTPEELQRLNNRWETFFRQKKRLIDYLSDYDEDLSSIAILPKPAVPCCHKLPERFHPG